MLIPALGATSCTRRFKAGAQSLATSTTRRPRNQSFGYQMICKLPKYEVTPKVKTKIPLG